jgi:hypothetical protein
MNVETGCKYELQGDCKQRSNKSILPLYFLKIIPTVGYITETIIATFIATVSDGVDLQHCAASPSWLHLAQSRDKNATLSST